MTNAVIKWQQFQKKSPYYNQVQKDGEESVWESIAGDYERMVYPNDGQKIILSHMKPKLAGCDTVLEIGPGPGTFTLFLSGFFKKVTAIEPSAAMTRVLKARLLNRKIRHVSVIQSRWEDISVESHDMVVACGCLYVFYDIDKVLLKMVGTARKKVLITHIGDGGVWDFERQILEALSLPEPCLFPSLDMVMDVLAFMKLPAKADPFMMKVNKRLSFKQWRNRCTMMLSVPEDRAGELKYLLENTLKKERAQYLVEENRPATVIEIDLQ